MNGKRKPRETNWNLQNCWRLSKEWGGNVDWYCNAKLTLKREVEFKCDRQKFLNANIFTDTVFHRFALYTWRRVGRHFRAPISASKHFCPATGWRKLLRGDDHIPSVFYSYHVGMMMLFFYNSPGYIERRIWGGHVLSIPRHALHE